MATELKVNKNQKKSIWQPEIHVRPPLTKAIVALYIFTLAIVSIGLWYAIQKKWKLQVEDTKYHLAISANVGNFLIESSIDDAQKSLENTQLAISITQKSEAINRQIANQILNNNYEKFKKYNKSEVFGKLFWINKEGILFANSGVPINEKINLQDRLYFTQLRDNPKLNYTIGPLVIESKTRELVFHFSVPIYSKEGKFNGVLVQQILTKEIEKKLTQYTDIKSYEQMITRINDSAPLLIFNVPTELAQENKNFKLLKFPQNEMTQENKLSTFYNSNHGHIEFFMMGSSKSPNYLLETYAIFPEEKVKKEFVINNRYLILYSLFGILFSTFNFYLLYKVSQRFANAYMASLHDALTEIYNRRALNEALPILTRVAIRSQEPMSVLFIDIDHFRIFNEKYGHQMGDLALQAVAQTLSECATRPLDIVCRWGGEEFVIVLPQTNRDGAKTISEKILTTVQNIQLKNESGERITITVSIGYVTECMTKNSDLENLVGEADKAMLIAKSKGRNRCIEYSPNY